MGPTETPKIDLNKSPGPSGMSARSNDMTHTCPKCLGTGNISAFGHISGGRCFTCGGTGKVNGHVGVVAQAQAKPYKAARRHASGGWEVDVMSGRVWLWDDGSTMVSNGLARRSEWAIQTARGLVAKAA